MAAPLYSDPAARLNADPYGFAGRATPAQQFLPSQPGGALGDMLRRRLRRRMGPGQVPTDIMGGVGRNPPLPGTAAGGPSMTSRQAFAGAHPELQF